MRKYLLLLCIPFFFILASCDDDTYTIDNVTIDATINDDGTIHVRELFTYTFSGEFNGTTRSIKSDVSDFKAYLANDVNNATDSTENLSDLKTEYDDDDDAYKIYTDSENETKTVLYDYNVKGSVEKYNDVGTILYTFFDETNETDLNNLKINIHSPSNTITDDTYAFLHDKDPEKLTVKSDGIEYETKILKKGDNAPIRFIFPADELDEQTITKNKSMKEHLIDEEEELADRYIHLDENMDRIKPYIWALFPIFIILWFIFFSKHPASKVKDKKQAEVVEILEKLDPLFAKYLYDNHVNFGRNVTNESIIAALFSLRRRGIVSIKKIPSEINSDEDTFRFTWDGSDRDVDEADHYLKEWLFTETGDSGAYFLLESITVDDDEPDSVKEEKAEEFEKGIETWSERVKSRDGYKDLRNIFYPFRILSVPITVVTYIIFYYFTQIDAVSHTMSWVLPLVFGIMAFLSLIFNRNKWLLSFFQVGMIIASFIWFTLTSTVILAIILFGFSLLILLISPSKYWLKEIRELKQVIEQAQKMFKKGEYPVSNDPNTNERQLEYAITLNTGEQYGEKCEKEGTVPTVPEYYPLLMNPSFVVNTLGTSNLIFYTAASTSSGSSGSSAGGGGGAGAF